MDNVLISGAFEGGREQTETTGYATEQEWSDAHANGMRGRKPSGDYLGTVYIDKNGFLILVETLRGTPPLSDEAFVDAHIGAINSRFLTDPPAFP